MASLVFFIMCQNAQISVAHFCSLSEKKEENEGYRSETIAPFLSHFTFSVRYQRTEAERRTPS